MTRQPAPLRVGWKVSALSPKLASVRYRAVLPMLALEPAGVQSRVFNECDEQCLGGLDALVIVKSFTADDLLLAQLARAKGIKVVFDLCDNIFVEGYGDDRKGVAPDSMLLSLAKSLDAIVVTTEPLARVLRERVPDVPVVVIPDGIEEPSLRDRIHQVLAEAAAREGKGRVRRAWRRRVRTARHLLRDHGVVGVRILVEAVARRLGGAVVRRMRHRLATAAPITAAARTMPPETPLPPADGVPRIVWFGNHGAAYGRFGMLDLLEWRDALEELARERAVELVVISNNREKYDTHIRPLRIPSRYIEWSPRATDLWLQDAAAVLIPNSLDPFSACKSANRSVLALARGLPVVATPTAALQPLTAFLELGDPLAGLRRVLDHPAAARARAEAGYREAEALFGAAALQQHWIALLEAAPAPSQPVRGPYLAVVLNLTQDLDLALPILKEARGAGVSAEAWCTADLLKKSPRVLVALKAEGLDFRLLPDAGALAAFRFPARTRVLLTVAETNLSPHRVPRMLTEAAARQGVLAATLQHGYENVGLTYDDEVQPLEKVSIAAPRIYTWGPQETLHPRCGPTVRARCVPVGCPKEVRVPPADVRGLLPADRPVIGVFENLHWHRYSDAYRAQFLQSVEQLARSFPHAIFLVKPHHAGMWLSRRYQGELPDAGNLLLADPKSREWERHTAPALLPHLAAVITTPSTVALDAARQQLPTAVFAGDLSLDNYEPLPLLAAAREWTDFVAQALDAGCRPALTARSERFVERVLVPGNAARRIVDDLLHTAGA